MSAEPIGQAWLPACMDAEELARWSKAPAGHVLSILPWHDCLVGFAAEMRVVGRCNGTPGGVEEDEEMDQPEPAAPRGLTITRRVQLDVSAPPCGSCAHEPVCALRAAFEGMATVETSAPPLPDGLRLALVATVECGHFLRNRAKPAPVRVLTSQERGQANGPGKNRLSQEARERMAAANTARAEARRAAREGVATG